MRFTEGYAPISERPQGFGFAANQTIIVASRSCLARQKVATLDGRQAKGVQPDKRMIRRTLVIRMEERVIG
jgi:hypothetical protein